VGASVLLAGFLSFRIDIHSAMNAINNEILTPLATTTINTISSSSSSSSSNTNNTTINYNFSEFGAEMELSWHQQDSMSIALLFGIISQAATMLYRGQGHFPHIYNNPVFFGASFVCLSIHVILLFWRASWRWTGSYLYLHSHLLLWPVLLAFPFIGLFIGNAINSWDERWYKRHLMFLRLEFDTRLGMHSPR
jgi:hypothetical protein